VAEGVQPYRRPTVFPALVVLFLAALSAVAILIPELKHRNDEIGKLRGELEELRAKLRKRSEPTGEAPQIAQCEPWIPISGIERVAFDHLIEGTTIKALGTALGEAAPICLREGARLREELRKLRDQLGESPDETPPSGPLDFVLAFGAIELMRGAGWKVVRLPGEVYKIDGWSP
jgi:hypothetical protein